MGVDRAGLDGSPTHRRDGNRRGGNRFVNPGEIVEKRNPVPIKGSATASFCRGHAVRSILRATDPLRGI
jgi:hypothetical protein